VIISADHQRRLDRSDAERAARPHFPVGYHHIHPNVSVNFQMNRWMNWMGAQSASALDEMRSVAPRIRTYPDFVREFLDLAKRSETEGQICKQAYYLRAAEFFMLPEAPEKAGVREHFVRLVREWNGISDAEYDRVPYGPGMLPSYVLAPERDVTHGTMVVHGGFDSYIEEWFPALLTLRDAGFRVIAFDGPGQGGALEEYGLTMTEHWEKPVGAVLDHFGLEDVTLLGFSLGGGLAIRAAAFEPRIRRVIADDIMTDFLRVTLRQQGRAANVLVPGLVAVHASGALDALLKARMRASLVAEWGTRQGMHVQGARTPAEFFEMVLRYATLPVSHLVKQDVLLMAGSEDHYVPLNQFPQQLAALTGARSVTARLFTRDEQAQNHCQVGNLGLSLRVIIDWILERTASEQNAVP
jgi:pimeloyl-ACP methyl ester carboxylesterase